MYIMLSERSQTQKTIYYGTHMKFQKRQIYRDNRSIGIAYKEAQGNLECDEMPNWIVTVY
jgi:hypothetical protein